MSQVLECLSHFSLSLYKNEQFDMTAWVKSGTREEVGIITDYTDERCAGGVFLADVVDNCSLQSNRVQHAASR
jgi:hypothetical protein